jgi:hypothetical protein
MSGRFSPLDLSVPTPDLAGVSPPLTSAKQKALSVSAKDTKVVRNGLRNTEESTSGTYSKRIL